MCRRRAASAGSTASAAATASSGHGRPSCQAARYACTCTSTSHPAKSDGARAAGRRPSRRAGMPGTRSPHRSPRSPRHRHDRTRSRTRLTTLDDVAVVVPAPGDRSPGLRRNKPRSSHSCSNSPHQSRVPHISAQRGIPRLSLEPLHPEKPIAERPLEPLERAVVLPKSGVDHGEVERRDVTPGPLRLELAQPYPSALPGNSPPPSLRRSGGR